MYGTHIANVFEFVIGVMAIATLINIVGKTAVNGKLSCTIAMFDKVSNRNERNQGYYIEAQGTHAGQFGSSRDVLDQLKLPPLF